MNKSLRKKLLVFLVVGIVIAIIWGTIQSENYDYTTLLNKEAFEVGEVFTPLDVDSPIDDFAVVAENKILKLMINSETTEIGVLDKRNNEIWYSNPIERNDDSLANPLEKSKMSSQIEFNFFNRIRKELTMNNFNDAIEKQQFKLETIENGVRVTYLMGNISLGYLLIPDYISAERLQFLVLDKLDAKTAKTISRRYVPSIEKEGFLQLNATTRGSIIVMDEFLSAFNEAGYTENELLVDLEAAGIELDLSKNFVEIPIEYSIEEEKLRVKIPVDKIEESEGVEIVRLDVLKFFGAGSLEDEGYMVVPSGTGGMIKFNNGKNKEDNYLQPIYGIDPMMLRNTLLKVEEPVRLPIYGIKKNNAAFIAYIEEGASLGVINARVSEKTGSYNYVYPSFIIRAKDMLSMSGVSGNEADLTILQEEHYQGDIIINYCFLDQEEADYSGMAKYYQTQLVTQGNLVATDEVKPLPFYLDIIGAVEKDMHLVGFPYKGLVRMTTFKQAELMVTQLAEKGINNIHASYIGWFNEGINHNVAKDIRIDRGLGSQKELESLESALLEVEGELYLDVALQLVNYKSKNYSEIKEAARYLDGFSGIVADYNRAFLRMGTNYWAGVSTIVSPNALPNHVKQLSNHWQDKTTIENISLRDLGIVLTSDQKKQYPIDREISRKIVEEQFYQINEKFQNIIVRGGNNYSFAYADHVLNVPETNNQFFIIDEQIPFYQMVLDGYISYAGSAINISEGYEYQRTLLKALEYGMAPHFLWSYEPTSNLNKTAFESLYSTQYEVWIESAVDLHNTLSEAKYRIGNGKMLKHTILEKGVNKMVYDNGVTVYVNYTNETVSVEDVIIEPMNYILKGVNE